MSKPDAASVLKNSSPPAATAFDEARRNVSGS
jgi:hypothetical protein